MFCTQLAWNYFPETLIEQNKKSLSVASLWQPCVVLILVLAFMNSNTKFYYGIARFGRKPVTPPENQRKSRQVRIRRGILFSTFYKLYMLVLAPMLIYNMATYISSSCFSMTFLLNFEFKSAPLTFKMKSSGKFSFRSESKN